MSDENRADDAYRPTRGDEEQEDAAPLDLQNALDERTYDDLLDEGYSPPEKPLGVTRSGTTAAEQRAGESLDDRLRQETPDVTAPAGDGIGDLPDGEGEPLDPEAGSGRAGRLVAPDERARAHHQGARRRGRGRRRRSRRRGGGGDACRPRRPAAVTGRGGHGRHL